MVTTSRLVRKISTFAVLIFGFLVSFSSFAQSENGISDAVRQQIADIASAKAALTPAQQKLGNLAMSLLKAQGSPAVASFANAIAPASQTDVVADSGQPAQETLSTAVDVEIYGTISDDLLKAVVDAGGTIGANAAAFGVVQARLPLGALETVAANSDVRQISKLTTGNVNVGVLTSQGFITHGAKTVVGNGIDGTGVTVGVMSDSASAARVSALMASGDLGPNTQVLAGQAGSGTDEGTAMMEIVQDMAPGAKVVFATAFGGVASFINNILALQAAGAKVIVDDVSYFAEGAFQDGPIAQAVNQVTGLGVTYFSSAANSGNLTLGTSGTWEGDFLSGGPVGAPISTAGETGLVHNFGTVGSPQTFDVLTAPGGASPIISLKWSDPLGASTNDYDIFVLNSTGTTIKGFSAATQSGTQDPLELFQYSGGAAGDRIVVVLFSGQPRALRIDTNRGRLSIATAGSTYGHNAGLNTMSTAATYWNSAHTSAKPFAGAANPIETFSSDGPRKIFYQPNGTPITPGNVLFGTNGGTTLQKPDITAADGVSTKTPGFLPFFGTSAASPHAAGIAALVLQAAPWATVAQVKAAMRNGTLDNMAPGVDRDSGFGIVMATLAVQYAITH